MTKRIAWGYVTRNLGNGDELLIGERNKVGDPLRQKQLTIPGGSLEVGEAYQQAASRETLEETGVETELPEIIKGHPFSMDNDIITAKADEAGLIHIVYKDSWKKYVGRIVKSIPTDIYQEPTQQDDSDMVKPRYIPIDLIDQEVVKRFTPACQFLLEMMRV